VQDASNVENIRMTPLPPKTIQNQGMILWTHFRMEWRTWNHIKPKFDASIEVHPNKHCMVCIDDSEGNMLLYTFLYVGLLK